MTWDEYRDQGMHIVSFQMSRLDACSFLTGNLLRSSGFRGDRPISYSLIRLREGSQEKFYTGYGLAHPKGILRKISYLGGTTRRMPDELQPGLERERQVLIEAEQLKIAFDQGGKGGCGAMEPMLLLVTFRPPITTDSKKFALLPAPPRTLDFPAEEMLKVATQRWRRRR